MGVSQSGAQMAKKIRDAAKALEKARLDAMDVVGKDMIDAARTAAEGDLGADAMFTGGQGRGSGWKAQLTTGFEKNGDGLVFQPKGQGKGAWRVAQSGRKAYSVGERRLTGKTSKKTGKALARKAYKRNVGATEGKDTWDDAVVEIMKVVPEKIRSNTANAVREVFR